MDRIRVLIADDTKETVDLVRKVLNIEQDKFLIVGEASNGEEALELVSTEKPDIVLMDINMPVMNGLEATEKITSDFPSVAVVIMSVQGENEYLRKAMLCGAKEYIVKPFNYNTLLETIQVTYDKNKELRELELLQNQMSEPEVVEEDNYTEEDNWEREDEQLVNSYEHSLEENNDEDLQVETLYIKGGHRATSLSIPVGGISRLVQPGHYVDVIVFLNDTGGDGFGKGISTIVIQNTKVLDVDMHVNNTFVTLSVPAQEVEKLILAENTGKIKMVIRAGNDQNQSNTKIMSWKNLEEKHNLQALGKQM